MSDAITTTRAPRVLAVTAAGDPIPRTFARLVAALRHGGAEVVPLPVPKQPASGAGNEATPTIAELKRVARDLVSALRGAEKAPAENWLVSQLRAVEGRVDAVVAVDPAVAQAVFPVVLDVFPDAVRVAVDGDYHVDPEWEGTPFDDLVLPNPLAARGLGPVREGRARLREGGPLVGGGDLAPKKLDPERPGVIVSFARLEPGDVDPLLFQISLANPSRFDLLFLPSGRPGVDELVRARAGGYGLRGKRPKEGADVEPWIRGASALVGFPSPSEAAAAIAAGVPQLYFGQKARLSPGDAFLVEHGLAALAENPITLSVQLEGLLPGGAQREAALQALAELSATGSEGAARAVLDAIAAGRPAPPSAEAVAAAGGGDDELEDIGLDAASAGVATELPPSLRAAYLKEIILQQKRTEKSLNDARAGIDTWQRRQRLARTANDPTLADKAAARVTGLRRVAERLAGQLDEVRVLRERFAGRGPLTPEDRAAATRFMSADTAAALDRGQAPESAFEKLELDDTLAALKRKIDAG
ncbi:MAG: hypothetical protein KC635_02275 [Myxococcales bacterium]|nr:hypothetical protein [Myxococcales bacterium]MCB9736369.1 hypothetical protein [Deltaproteobacteria bacterium]